MHKHAYRLRTTTVAKKKAKKLTEIVSLMGFELKLSRAQELVAQLMGYDDWAELLNITQTSPEKGAPDSLSRPAITKARRQFQSKVLPAEFGIDEWDAETVLKALNPTDGAFGNHWKKIEDLGLRLTEQDEAFLEVALSLVRRFDAAARPLYSISGTASTGLTHIRLERVLESERKLHNRRSTTVADIVGWVAHTFPDDDPLGGDTLDDVTAKAEAALLAFQELDDLIRSLGQAPMLAPIHWTFLMLYRSHVSRGDRHHFTAICPEPWLHIGFDLPNFFHNPENEWSASRAMILQLALRREFIDAGWHGDGEEWRVTFRDGNSAKEEMTVQAHSGGAAFAWAAAARAALHIAKAQKVKVISLISALGPDGIVNRDQVLADALNQDIIKRGKLVPTEKLRIRGSRKAA